ncbi:unnamed protein product [marine sediment metagenome]|uniref:Uncharacterized protein n=1 Tax=marine sediment metagenome TaxID=412755 RepID=X0TVX2_9ZZZZ
MRTMNVRTVFVDIDNTLTEDKPEFKATSAPDVSFVRLVMAANSISEKEASKRIAHHTTTVEEMVGYTWPFEPQVDLCVTEAEVARALQEDFKERYRVFPDAELFLKGLRQYSNIQVHTATTNPKLYSLAKLGSAGLADATGSPYLDGCHGGGRDQPWRQMRPRVLSGASATR